LWVKVKESRIYWVFIFQKNERNIKTAPTAHTVGERGGGVTGFAVLEQGEQLARRLVARFGPPVGAAQRPGLLVVAPEVCLTAWGKLECETVLLPGNMAHQLGTLRARSAVSYGLSGRDTITLSSKEGRRLWVAVQRDLVRLNGTVLERQEFPIRIPEGADELQTLALAGAMLLLGALAEEL